MGGPTVSLWLREALMTEQIAEIDAWLRTLSGNVERDSRQRRFGDVPDNPNWELSVCEEAFEGRPSVDLKAARPVGIEITPFGAEACSAIYQPESWFDFINDSLGFVPRQNIQFDAYCNQSVDHRVLGLLITRFAEKFDALVNIGWVEPPSLGTGQIYRVEWIEEEDNRIWGDYLLDVAAFRAWRQHPQFRLLK